MITWEITRVEWGGDKYSQEAVFPISYTCNVCGNQWSNNMKKPKPRMKTITITNHPLYGDHKIRVTLKEWNWFKKEWEAFFTAQRLLANIK